MTLAVGNRGVVMLIINTEQLTETVAPSTEPLSTTEAKSHLKVSVSTDDTLIDRLIIAAREYVELFTGRSYARHTYRADLSAFHDETLFPYRPIQSITNIKYYSTASPQVLTTLNANVYSQKYDHRIVLNDGQSWPDVSTRFNAVQVTFLTGYADTSSPVGTGPNMPQGIKQIMYLIIGDLYENRAATVVIPGQGISITDSVHRAVHAMMGNYRVRL